MSIIKNFPGASLVSEESISINTIPKDKKEYYKNLIRYLDEYTYFQFLKTIDPNYGFNFTSQLNYYLREDFSINIYIILYQRAFPEDEEINTIILDLIKVNVDNGILAVTQNILDIKEELS